MHNIFLANNKKSKFNMHKWIDILQCDFKIAANCCDIMKKKPCKIYEHETDKKPIIATMTQESMTRENNWLKSGCNAFENGRPISMPMSFWTEQDILHYVKENDIKLSSVYGNIAADTNGQIAFEDCGCRLCTTGEHRTGCIFCGFGAHLEKGEGRFQRLKRTHPKQYDFCINGGSYDQDGIWKPDSKGLGMSHVFDELNKLYGENFIKYK